MATANKASIIIRVAAGHSIGMGHLFRMITLGEYLKKSGYSILFIVKENPIAQKILKGKGIPIISLNTSDNEKTAIENILKTKCFPRLWIFDTFGTKKEWYTPLHEASIPVVTFDDTDTGAQKANIVINAIAGLWDYQESNVNTCSGLPYIIMSPEIQQYRRRRVLSDEKIALGVSLGGSDTHGNTYHIARILPRIERFLKSATFFLGPHFKENQNFDRLLAKKGVIPKIVRAPRNLFRHLNTMDVVICGGGMTLFELGCMGIPVMALANEPHEEMTISYMGEKKACHILPSPLQQDTKILADQISDALNNVDQLNLTSVNAMNLIDGKGLDRILNRLSELIAA